MAGPLSGLKVIEMVGIGPGPFCAMALADLGAEVIRIDRPQAAGGRGAADKARFDVLARNRRSVCIDLRKPGGAEAVLALVERADILIEGFRPGVMERLGLGPEVCLARNPRLVFGRMTGWGQFGPLSQAAGHDINYISIAGALAAIGRPGEKPAIPLNYIGDFGGGGMLLAFGVMCALHEARQSGKGQVVDAAMTDGTAMLSAMMYGMRARGTWSTSRGENLLDGGAHFYDTYTCADGKCVSVGAIEPQFYARLRELCGITDPAFDAQLDPAGWPALKQRLAEMFRTRTRDEWCALLEGSDACFAPVLDWDEAPGHPHNQARGTFVDVAGVMQPAPAPRFSRTPPATPVAPSAAGADTDAVLRDWGFDAAALGALRGAGVIGAA
ncbi:MAG: CaiB/BaiF CoA-transferase family protein [Burkholderiales bacterium]